MRIKVGYKDIEGSAHKCMPSPQRKRIASATSSAIISVPTRGRPLTVYHKSICTQSRDRTGTNLRPLVFETNASTYSAIWARCETERKDSTNSRSPLSLSTWHCGFRGEGRTPPIGSPQYGVRVS